MAHPSGPIRTTYHRVRRLVKARGVVGAVKRLFLKATSRWRKNRAKASTTAASALGLAPGDLVRVRSEMEIRGTLDVNGKLRGLTFVPEMVPHCGKTYRVLKRVERILLEHSGEVRRIRDTVLLDGVQCQGGGVGCDRLCYLYWREAWLEHATETLADVENSASGGPR